MPRIDPISGCTMMTHQEFWTAEAASEGKGRTASDLMADFINELDAANATQADRYRTDLAWTTEQLQAAIADYNDGVDPIEELPSLVRVLEVLEADVQDGVRSSSLFLRVRALRAASPEPIEDVLDYTDVATSGSRMEPPDRESSFEWRTLNNNPRVMNEERVTGSGGGPAGQVMCRPAGAVERESRRGADGASTLAGSEPPTTSASCPSRFAGSST